MNNIATYWTNGVRVPWFTKKTGRLVSKSYAVQKQREEVVGQFSQIISPKMQISFVKVTDVLLSLTIFHFKAGLTQASSTYLSLTLLNVVRNLFTKSLSERKEV